MTAFPKHREVALRDLSTPHPRRFANESSGLVIRLSADWAIGADEQQWIVLKATGNGIQRRWKPVGYIGSTRATLVRVLREKGAVITFDGRCALDSLPERFFDWRRQRDGSNER